MDTTKAEAEKHNTARDKIYITYRRKEGEKEHVWRTIKEYVLKYEDLQRECDELRKQL